MRKSILIVIAIMTLLLAGCGEAETVVDARQPESTELPAIVSTEQPEMEAALGENEPASYPELVEAVQAIISDAEEKAAANEANGANLITQTDMNTHSYDLYMIWDDAINDIWALFDENLDRDSFYNIQTEQIAWITEKETELQKIRDEYEGGSIAPLACNLKAAEMTKDRIYELLEYIK